MTPPKFILVISLRFLGDVLLTTPLIRALARGYEGAKIDVLLPAGAGGMLEGNSDVRGVIPVAARPGFVEHRALVRRLWRRYDFAVVAETGDRPHAYGLLAAPLRAGLLPTELLARWWKAPLLQSGVPFGPGERRIDGYRRLAQELGLDFVADVVAPSAGTPASAWSARLGFDPSSERCAVLNLAPRFRYKRWHAEGWRALIGWLHAERLRIVITGGDAPEEHRYVQEVLGVTTAPTVDLTGQLSFGETADLLRLAALYVGPDTATSHVAAACGTPAVVLFGPTDPRLWGPVPRGGLYPPYAMAAPLQGRGNVQLVQETSLACMPCQQEGCDRHRESYSACLDAMSAARVIAAARERLGG